MTCFCTGLVGDRPVPVAVRNCNIRSKTEYVVILPWFTAGVEALHRPLAEPR
jgi:hypothetical protein